MEDLLRTIAKQINIKFNHRIDLQDSEGIERPSFFIYCAYDNDEEYNKYAVIENLIIQIVYFAPLLKGKLADRLNQTETIQQLKEIFSISTLDVGDITYQITRRNTGYTATTEQNNIQDIYLQLYFKRIKDRVLNEETYDLMEDISFNLQNNEEVN